MKSGDLVKFIDYAVCYCADAETVMRESIMSPGLNGIVIQRYEYDAGMYNNQQTHELEVLVGDTLYYGVSPADVEGVG
jgi:hypothetical protein